MRLSVIIVSWRRPDYVRRSLECLTALDAPVSEVIIVDASVDDATEQVVAGFPGVRYLRFVRGAGRMTTARNAGLLRATGDIIAFLDDDAWVRPQWSTALLRAYTDPDLSAAVGRTCNGTPGEEFEGVSRIGRIEPDGQLTGNFAADPGSSVVVDHGIGANMSFRREVLEALGGFRDDFRGTGAVREDADMFLRVRALNGRSLFVPDAVVDHVGAPHARGKRFDWRYMFWARYNHVLLLSRNFGLTSRLSANWVARELRTAAPSESEGSLLRQTARAALRFAAIALGLGASLRKARPWPSDPRRRDKVGRQISAALACQSRSG